MDVLSPAQRRLNMSRIRGKDTKPELLLRRALHAAGFRYRLHVVSLPGRPDMVLSRYRTAIFVHGCFWHGHECPNYKIPATRTEFWKDKVASNRARDLRTCQQLLSKKWRVIVVWECALSGRARIKTEDLVERCRKYLLGDVQSPEVGGDWSKPN